MDLSAKEIGNRIKQYRKAKPLTQKELAEMVDCAEMTISQYERGLYSPKIDMRVKIANALGVSYADLFMDQTPMSFDSPEDFKKAWEEAVQKSRESTAPEIAMRYGADGTVTNEVITHQLDVTDLSAVEREELENYKEYLIYKRSKNS